MVADRSWNRPKSAIITFVQAFPLFGKALDPLDNLDPVYSAPIALILLMSALAWLGYQVYDRVVLSRHQQALSRLKLNLDIAKAKYDVLAASASGSPGELEFLRGLALPLLEEFRHREPPPSEKSWVQRLRKLDTFVIRAPEQARLSEIYAAEWRIRARSGVSHMEKMIKRRKRALRGWSVLLALYGLLTLALPIMLGASQPAEVFSLAVPYTVMGVIMLYYAAYWSIRRRLTIQGYELVKSELGRTGSI